jgi:cysteine-rich repeat protein
VGFGGPPGATGACGQQPTIDATPVVDADISMVDADISVADAMAPPDANLCGNGAVDSGEDCDDMNTSQNDACRNDCRYNICGDSFVRTGVEECDDGNTTSGDTCSRTCLACAAGAGVDGAFFSDVTDHCYRRAEAAVTPDAALAFCEDRNSYRVKLYDNATLKAQFATFMQRQFYWSGAVYLSGAAAVTNWGWPQGDTFTNASPLWQTVSDAEPDSSPSGTIFPNVALEENGVNLGLDDKAVADTNVGTMCEQDSVTILSDRHAYIHFTKPLAWAAAKTACEALAPGKSHLATAETAKEMEELVKLTFIGRTWFGASDDNLLVPGASEDNFRWIGGAAVDPAIVGWAGGMPTPSEDALDCGAYNHDTRQFEDRDCLTALRYICEIE